MATYTFTRGLTGYTSLKRVPYLVETVVDFAQVNSDSGTAAADVLEMINVPAGTIVLDAGLENLSALTVANSPTLDLQCDATANKWVNASTVITATYHAGVLTEMDAFGSLTAGTDGGFDSADTIDILCNTGEITAGIIRCWALLLDVSSVSNIAGSHKASAYDTATA